jgi:hypothetical protein
LLGFGQRQRLVAFEEEEEVRAVVLGQLAAVGFGGVCGIGRQAHPGQVHLGQMSGHSGLFVGIPRHDHLIDQALVGGVEIDQGQGFVGFRLLEFERDFRGLGRGAGRQLGRGTGRSRLGVFEHFAVGMDQPEGLRVLGLHPIGQHFFEFFGVHLLE